jgi:hypothetical protein
VEPDDDLALDEDHQLEGDLEEPCGQQREREALADDRRDVLVLDGEIEDDDVDEEVDDVCSAGADPPAPLGRRDPATAARLAWAVIARS